ncbi:MAG: hypothetical protein SH848_03660 [Saprospiraceae bacterium]|nr:hypothetical protein [Saprospiraceae bacterium]MDZ4702996.1 hypothetical protein [Saprospiraceae bacterium]
MIVVSDTTALSTLYLIDRLDLLKQMFGQVIIPQAVFDELLELELSGYDINIFKKADWLIVKDANHHHLISELQKELDLGESEAIVLALEKMADYLLIDERKAP